jgi:hypothetical protein
VDADGIVEVVWAGSGVAQVGAIPHDHFKGERINHLADPTTTIVQEQVMRSVAPHAEHALPADGVVGQHVAVFVQFHVDVLAVAQKVAVVALAI